MFNNKKINQYEKDINFLKQDIRHLESTNKSYQNHIDELLKKVKNNEEDTAIILKRKDAEVDVKVSVATKELTKQLAQVTSERDNYKKESEILNKAFENLGFDVKDMKDILNKLVDGIVSKNTIQLVK